MCCIKMIRSITTHSRINYLSGLFPPTILVKTNMEKCSWCVECILLAVHDDYNTKTRDVSKWIIKTRTKWKKKCLIRFQWYEINETIKSLYSRFFLQGSKMTHFSQQFSHGSKCQSTVQLWNVSIALWSGCKEKTANHSHLASFKPLNVLPPARTVPG